MKNTWIFIYDDHIKPSGKNKNIIGELHFGSIMYQKATFGIAVHKMANSMSHINREIVTVNYRVKEDLLKIEETLDHHKDAFIVHCFSFGAMYNRDKFTLLLEKLSFADNNTCMCDKDVPTLLSFTSVQEYKKYLPSIIEKKCPLNKNDFSFLEVRNECSIDVSVYGNLVNFLSGRFDARFFNQVVGDQYTVTKTSKDINKMFDEYSYYHLLPEEMQSDFVLPYNYVASKSEASYTMTRYFFPDVAIRWVHKAIDYIEFEQLLDKLFRFLKNRTTKNISIDAYKQSRDEMFLNKLDMRIEQLKADPSFSQLENYISQGTCYSGIDDIIKKYKKVFLKIKDKTNQLAVGHGDLCFSNILYDKETSTMKLIDPKGANKEEELWMHPYYDYAKLSHSICGEYDFINNGLFDIELDDALKLVLNIDIDSKIYKELFYERLLQENINPVYIRVYEVSLFLSMLPLHMDYERKVLAFILNAIKILEEIEYDV